MQNVAASAVTPRPFFENALGGTGSAFCKGYSSCTVAIASSSMATSIDQANRRFRFLERDEQRQRLDSGPHQHQFESKTTDSLGTGGSVGYRNYNALFVTFRMRDWHGLT